MEKMQAEARARAALTAGDEELAAIEELEVRPPHRAGHTGSFYEGFALRGIRVVYIRPGSVSCIFGVPPRLTDSSGKLSAGAIANLVDEVGAAASHAEGHDMKVSVDMSISYMSPALLHDELEITAKVLGHKGGYSGTHILVKNKLTGEVVAEGRHSLFGKLRSKM